MKRQTNPQLPDHSLVRGIWHSKLCRFGTVGVINTAVSYVVFIGLISLLSEVTGRAAIAQMIAYCAGMATSFALNSIWTFQVQDRIGRRLPRFVMAQTFCAVFSSAVLSLLIEQNGWPPTETWIAVSILIVLLNFMLQSLWVYAD